MNSAINSGVVYLCNITANINITTPTALCSHYLRYTMYYNLSETDSIWYRLYCTEHRAADAAYAKWHVSVARVTPLARPRYMCQKLRTVQGRPVCETIRGRETTSTRIQYVRIYEILHH
ncbi:hypothetical protein J6590_016991 [Homalodisca vitripennis]|nr:hypothetical protein J6590_016991 [Homalodisca vitripennis]